MKTKTLEGFRVGTLATFFSQLLPTASPSPIICPALILIYWILLAAAWSGRFCDGLPRQGPEEPSRQKDHE